MKPGFLAILIGLTACNGSGNGPDLSVVHQPVVTAGEPQICADPRYFRIENKGNRAAFAVVLQQWAGQGLLDPPLRIYPGPEPGESLLALVCAPESPSPGWCVEAHLQRLQASDPQDLNALDNQWCSITAMP